MDAFTILTLKLKCFDSLLVLNVLFVQCLHYCFTWTLNKRIFTLTVGFSVLKRKKRKRHTESESLLSWRYKRCVSRLRHSGKSEVPGLSKRRFLIPSLSRRRNVGPRLQVEKAENFPISSVSLPLPLCSRLITAEGGGVRPTQEDKKAQRQAEDAGKLLLLLLLRLRIKCSTWGTGSLTMDSHPLYWWVLHGHTHEGVKT